MVVAPDRKTRPLRGKRSGSWSTRDQQETRSDLRRGSFRKGRNWPAALPAYSNSTSESSELTWPNLCEVGLCLQKDISQVQLGWEVGRGIGVLDKCLRKLQSGAMALDDRGSFRGYVRNPRGRCAFLDVLRMERGCTGEGSRSCRGQRSRWRMILPLGYAERGAGTCLGLANTPTLC